MAATLTEIDDELGAEVGGLYLSAWEREDAGFAQKALQWRGSLARLGLAVPLWLVADLTWQLWAVRTGSGAERSADKSLATGDASLPNLPAHEARALARWRTLLGQLGRTSLFEQEERWSQRDELVVAVLFRLLTSAGREMFPVESFRGDTFARPRDPSPGVEPLIAKIPELYERYPRQADLELLRGLSSNGVRLLVAANLIRPEVLRLFGIFGEEARRLGSLDFADVIRALESDESGEVARFSFDLLPSLLETRRASGRQAFAMDGYDGVERHGAIDSMVMTELALDEELFQQRFIEGSLLYFTHAKHREEEGRLHYVCVDASASMRGPRSVFARGLALALLKRISLAHEDAHFRFFDSRLYPPQSTRRGRRGQGGINLAQVMTFRGERGRNYAKVFSELTMELTKLARRDPRAPNLYLLTHAQCHVPKEIVERLGRHAKIHGIFMMPSRGELELDYLDQLTSLQVVREETLDRRDERAKSALRIVEASAADAAVVEGGTAARNSRPRTVDSEDAPA